MSSRNNRRVKTRQIVTNRSRGRGRANNNREEDTIKGEGQVQRFAFCKQVLKTRLQFSFRATLSTDAVGNFVHRFSLRNLTRAVNGTGTYEGAVNISNEWDVYRPVALTIETIFIPSPNFSMMGFVLCKDEDDDDLTNTVTLASTALAYRGRKFFDPRNKEVTRLKIDNLTSGSQPGTLSNAPVTIHEGGFLDFQAAPYQGVAYMVANGLSPNMAILDTVLTMDVEVKMAR